MGLFSSSKTKNVTQNTSVTNTRNDNISGLDDSNLYRAGGNVTVNTLDGGAVSGALDSLDSAVGSLGDFAGGVARGAFDTAASAVDAVGASQRNALRYGTDSLDSVLEFGGDIIDSQQRQLTNTLASINAANATTAQLEGVNAVKSAGLISSTVRDSVKYLALAGAVYALARYLKG